MNLINIIITVVAINYAITIPFATWIYYRESRGKGRRTAIIESIKGFFLGMIPIVSTLGVTLYFADWIHQSIKTWVENDPTAPQDDIPVEEEPEEPTIDIKEESTEEIVDPIEDRFEVMDL